MLRAHRTLLLGWVLLVAIAAAIAIEQGWAQPRLPDDYTSVTREGTAERTLRDVVDARLERMAIGYGPTTTDADGEPVETLDAAAARADSLCVAPLPYRHRFRGYVAPLDVTVIGVRRAQRSSDAHATTTAPAGSTYVEVTIEVDNRGEAADYPSNHVVLVDGTGTHYTRSWVVPSHDWIGAAEAGDATAGVLVFEVADAQLGVHDPVYVVVGSPLYDATSVALQMQDQHCVRVHPQIVEEVGDSPWVAAWRRVR